MESLYHTRLSLMLKITSRVVPASLWLAGLIQAVAVLLQKVGVVRSFSAWFSVSGTFTNPAHSACLIAASIAVALVFVQRRRIIRSYAALVMILEVVALVICGSRACILAVVLVALFVFKKRLVPEVLPMRKKIKRALLITTGSLLALTMLYFIRPSSADARLLIWRVCWEMYKEAPLTGIGSGNLKYRYMYAQADYFSNHPFSRFSSVASNCCQSYNEFIRIGCENGAIGLVIIVLATVLLLRKSDDYFRAPLITFVVESCFLYTTDIRPLVVAMDALIICIVVDGFSKNKQYLNALCGPVLSILILIAPFIPVFNMKSDITSIGTTSVVPIPSYEDTCRQGTLALEAGRIDDAENLYYLASNMIPERLYAYYCLFELYVSSGDERASQMAEYILDFHPKVFGDATIEIKRKVREWLLYDSSSQIPPEES